MSTARLLAPALVYAGILTLSSLPAERFDGIDLPGGVSYLVHLVEYTALGVALRWSFDRPDRPSEGTGRPLTATVLVGAVLAIADETFQSTVPGRHPSALDALVDVVGVALGALLVGRLLARRAARPTDQRDRRARRTTSGT